VAAAEAVAGDRRPIVRRQRHRLVDARGSAIADDPVFKEGDELSVREVVDLAEDLPRAVILDPWVSAADQRQDGGHVGRASLADFQPGGALLAHQAAAIAAATRAEAV
jgi:hypothetical protein